MLLFPEVIMTLYLYDFLFRDMVSGVEGHKGISWPSALPRPACFILKLF